GLVGRRDVADQVEIDAAQELGVVGLGRRRDLVLGQALLDGGVDELRQGRPVHADAGRLVLGGGGDGPLALALVLLGGVGVADGGGEGQDGGQAEGAAEAGSTEHRDGLRTDGDAGERNTREGRYYLMSVQHRI